jgi:hypothetical protein
VGGDLSAPITTADFVGIVGGNYLSPHEISIPASAYVEYKYTRSVLLLPKSISTVGTCYIFPGAYPSNDLASIPIPAGQPIFFDARGSWYIKTGSAATEKFLVIDAGGAANAAAAAALLGGGTTGTTPVANRAAWVSVVKNTVTAGTPVNASSQAVPSGFSVMVKARPNNTGHIGIGTSSANANLTTGAPTRLAPGESVRLYITNHNLIWIDSAVNGEGASLSNEV